MKYLNLLGLVCLFVCSTMQDVQAQYLISAEHMVSYTKSKVDSLLDSQGVPSGVMETEYDVDVYKVLYNSTSFDGSNVVASGIMVVPQLDCALPIFNWSHGTISRRNQAPSASIGGTDILICGTMAANGYLSFAPDYFGLGEDDSMLHPYQHADTEANSVIDFIRAIREFCENQGIELNDQIFLSGYSQGGHVTMAAHKKMQLEFPDEFTVTASAPMSGAYDMSGVMVDVMLSGEPYPDPAYLPFILFSWAQIYDYFPPLEEVIKPEYYPILSEMFDGNYSMGQINGVMPAVPTDILMDHVIEEFANDPNHYFRIALAENDTYTGWVPESPMNMYYCPSDEVVDSTNTTVAYQTFIDNGCMDCDAIVASEDLGHTDCAQFAIIMTKFWFDDMQLLCPLNAVDTEDFQAIKIFPNPASDKVMLRYDLMQPTTIQYQLFDAFGKKLWAEQAYQQSGSYTKEWDISNLTSGLYFLSMNNQVQKIMITR